MPRTGPSWLLEVLWAFCSEQKLAVMGGTSPICSGRRFILGSVQGLPFIVNMVQTLMLMSCESGAFIEDSVGGPGPLPPCFSRHHPPNTLGSCNHMHLLISTYLHMAHTPASTSFYLSSLTSNSLLSVGSLVETWDGHTQYSHIGWSISFLLSHHSLDFSTLISHPSALSKGGDNSWHSSVSYYLDYKHFTIIHSFHEKPEPSSPCFLQNVILSYLSNPSLTYPCALQKQFPRGILMNKRFSVSL